MRTTLALIALAAGCQAPTTPSGSGTTKTTDGTPGVDSGTTPTTDTETSGTTPPTTSTHDSGGTTETTGDPPLSTVFIILMENHKWADIEGSNDAPYINDVLLPQGALALSYKGGDHGTVHPSEPNYIWLEAGDTLGIDNDDDPNKNEVDTTDHLVTQMRNHSPEIIWKSWQEDMPPDDCGVNSDGLYAAKHNPMAYFTDVTDDHAYCVDRIRPFDELTPQSVAQYNFITPNLCNDMHGAFPNCTFPSVSQGDDWLSQVVPQIMASQAYQDGGVIFITWDEAENNSDADIGMLVLSPKAKPGYTNTIEYDHSSTLRTIQEIFGLTPFLGAAAGATDLSDLFTSFP
jgi:hypothetical protein